MFTVFVYAAYCRTGQTDKHSEDLPRQGWGEYCRGGESTAGSRKAEYDLDIRGQEDKLIQRNRELEAREVLRQLEEHRLEREHRDRAAEEVRIRDKAAEKARVSLRK